MPTVNSHSQNHDLFLSVCTFVEYESTYLDYYVGGEGLPSERGTVAMHVNSESSHILGLKLMKSE